MFKTILTIILVFGLSSAEGFSKNKKFKQGSFLTDSKKAFPIAKANSKLLLIDFYGIWCPPCNQLDETVFESAAFLEKSKDFVLLRVDADAKSSWDIKSRYEVGGYPTIVFANPDGEEVHRIVGYLELRPFLKAMDWALKHRQANLTKLCASSDIDEVWQCSQLCSFRRDNKCAQAAYDKLNGQLEKGSYRDLTAQEFFVEQAANNDLRKDGYERLMKTYPQSSQTLLWAYSYLTMLSQVSHFKPDKKLVRSILSKSRRYSDDELAQLGLTGTDIIQMRASLWEQIGEPSKAKPLWEEAAAELSRLAKQLPKDNPGRSFAMERITCLENAGQFDEALKVAQQFRAKFFDEFTFHHKTAALLFRANRYKEALPVAKKAYETSYGDNKIQSAELYIKLLAVFADKKTAKAVYEKVKKEIAPSEDLRVRTHALLEKLDRAWVLIGK